MAKPTPGPWEIERILEPYEGSDGEGDDEQDAWGAELSVPAWHGFVQIWAKDGEEVTANAFLIAAAPEMYEALKLLASDKHHVGYEAAMRAIAKAEGRD